MHAMKYSVIIIQMLLLFTLSNLQTVKAQLNWVTNLTSLSGNNYGYDIDYDSFGNIYVYGGYAPPKIAKYNSLGILQWTFLGDIASPSWSSEGTPSTNKYVGNFVVNKSNGSIYIGQPWDASAQVRAIRLDTDGNYDSLITSPDASFAEIWDMGYDELSGKVYAFGGGMSSNKSATIINPITGAISPVSFFPSNSNPGQDIACNIIDDSGTVFVYYAASGTTGINNYIARINSAFTGVDWALPATYISMSELSQKGAYINNGGITSNGFNCLAVNDRYLYFYDGFNLSAYDKLSGAKLAFITIIGQTIKAQGGIAVDDCNNVYVGGDSLIKTFNFNGSSFINQADIPIHISGTQNKYIYDLKLDKAANLIYVSGSGFVGSYSAINSMDCNLTSGIKQSETNNNLFSIYPNPFEDAVTVERINSHTDNIKIKIYDESGKAFTEVQMKEAKCKIKTETFSRGVYFIVIIEDNISVYSTKLLKK